MTPDDLAIYFSSTRPGGKGGQDVWVASRTSAASAFGTPVVVSEVNTTSDDVPSFITADRCTLYLSSTAGGSFQVYVATFRVGGSPPQRRGRDATITVALGSRRVK